MYFFFFLEFMFTFFFFFYNNISQEYWMNEPTEAGKAGRISKMHSKPGITGSCFQPAVL